MNKKILSVLLAVVMVLGMLPFTAFADNEEPGNTETTGTQEETVEIKVVPANLTGGSAEKPQGDAAATYTVAFDTTTTTQINVAATDLEKTENAANPSATDYWVGVGLTKQDGATYAWGFTDASGASVVDDSELEYTEVERTQEVDGTTYTTLYWATDDENDPWSETEGYISVKVGDDVTDYTVKFSVSVKAETTTPGEDEDDNTPSNPDDNDDNTPSNPGPLNFDVLAADALDGGKIFGMDPAALGTFEVDPNGATITVTGAANYITWGEDFSSTESEQAGHYLPIRIYVADEDKATAKDKTVTLTGSNSKTLTFGDDGSFELAMFLDKLTNGTFTVVYDSTTTYTVDCTGVDLNEAGEIAAPVEDNTVKPSEDAVEHSVTAQLEDENATKVTISVTVSEEETVTKTEVPLTTDALGALEEVEKPLAIDTPQGGVSVEAKTLIATLGKNDAVSFKMENTTTPSTSSTAQTFKVGFYKDSTEVEVKGLSTKITLTFKTSFEEGTAVTVTAEGTEEETTVGAEGVVEIETNHLSDWTITKKETTPTPPPVVTPAELKVEKDTGDDSNFYPVKVTGMTSGKYYVIRIAKSSAQSSNAVLIPVTGKTEYSFSTVWNSEVTVMEFDSASDLNGDSANANQTKTLTCS